MIMTIPDDRICDADPEEIIAAFSQWVYKLVNQYRGIVSQRPDIDMEDLEQAGKLAILQAQKTYQAEKCSFLTWSGYYIKTAIHNALSLRKVSSSPETGLLSLDASIQGADGITLASMIPDDHPTREEELIEQAEREEVAEAVRDAVGRLKANRIREAVQRIWLDGQDKKTAAEQMGITIGSLRMYDKTGRDALRLDKRLQKLVYPSFNVGLTKYRSTLTSSVEAAVLWREQHFDSMFGVGSFAGTRDRDEQNEQWP